jgi:Flp pilus assembly protein TadD
MIRFRLLPFAAIWFIMTAAVAAQPTAASMHPGEKFQSSPSLGAQDAQKVGSLFLAMCMNHFVHGELTWAEQSCRQAIEANPREVDAYKLRGYVYLLGHRFEQAAQDFRVALRLRPADSQEIAGYGQSMSGMGKFSDAAGQFRKALSMSPRYAAYWNGLCWALAGEGRQLDKALDACNEALSLVPGAAGTLNSRAMVYLLTRRYPLAVADYTASLAVQPDQASAWFGRGLARLNLRDVEGASDISEARHRDPEVDGLFVQMKALAAHCVQSGKSDCPSGFPPKPEARPGAYQVALLHADPDQELAAGIRSAGKTSVADIKGR